VTYQAPPPTRDRPAFLARHLPALIVLGVAVVFIIENTRRIRIRALGPEVTAPLWLVLLITLVAGMLDLAPIQRRRRR
jgi:uncharacterized integral membrane protein